jgi:serine protease Do
VFVADVTGTDSPAAKAGLQSRDVITAFNGKPVKAPRELTDAVAATPVGTTVQVDFIRGGQPQSVTVQLAERPDGPIARAPQPEFDLPLPGVPEESVPGARQGRLGIQGDNVTPELAERMGLKSQDGVLVMSVRPGSPASEAGVAHGDVIHSVGNTRVKTIEELVAALQTVQAGQVVLVEIERGNRTIYLNVTLD